jgi:hypothetical protein
VLARLRKLPGANFPVLAMIKLPAQVVVARMKLALVA